MAVVWNYQMRKNLEYLLKEGYVVTEISKMLHISRPTVVAEIKRGLSPEDADKNRFVKYDVGLSIRNFVVGNVGEEGLEALIRCENGKSKG